MYLPLKEKYLQDFPAIFRKEIKPISNLISEYNRTGTLSEKRQNGQSIIDTMHYYNKTHDRLLSIDSALTTHYNTIKENYKQDFRPIYKNEVSPIDQNIKDYSDISLSKPKLDNGNRILEKIELLKKNYDLMEKQNKEIAQRFKTISDQYESDFPNIHKSALKIFEEKLSKIADATSSESYLEKCNDFQNDLSYLEDKYEEIKDQQAKIESQFTKIEGLYQIDFPELFDNEIKEEQAKLKDYLDDGEIERKLTTGGFILETLEKLQSVQPQLKEENTKIKAEFPTLVNNYKENFYVLYKAHVDPLKDSEKTYEKTGYHIPKLNLSNDIVSKIDLYAQKYDVLKAQKDMMKSKYDEFIYNYEGRDQVKKMYKKGKWAYDQMKDSYEAETDFDKKEEKGEQIILMLLQFLSLVDKENSIINDEIRKAKTVGDVLRIIGIE